MRCPAGQASLAWHSGGAGAPPGSTKRPCQELADDRKAQSQTPAITSPEALFERRNAEGSETARGSQAGHLRRKRGPVVRKSSHVARRKAPAQSPSRSRSIGLRLSARHPLKARTHARRGKGLACLVVAQQFAPYLPLVGRSGVALATLGWGLSARVTKRRPNCETHTPPGALKRARHPPHQGEGWSKGQLS